jgi:hypothetical protein
VDIVLFSTADWDNPFWTNKQHMTKTFEENGHRVIYIDSLGLRKLTATTKDFSRIFKRFKSLIKPYSRVSRQIWCVSPFILPFHNIKSISFFNKWFLFFIIRLLSYFLDFKKVVVWTYSPVTDDIVDLFNKSLLVYHCVDDLRASPGIDAQMIEQRENSLVKKSNFVFTTSQALYDRLFLFNEKTYYFNNVCDYKHFSKATKVRFEEPADLINIKKTRILFIGALSSYKVDFELIAYVAQSKPDWEWILIGEIGEGEPLTNIDLLKNLENIHFLGPKSYHELPIYLQYSDVTVIPARINQYTDSMFPMKFFEYLSAGKQVVTTNLISLHSYSDLYFNSSNNQEFLQNLETILDNGIDKNNDKILETCLEQTWQKRYHQMMKHMQPYLDKENV